MVATSCVSEGWVGKSRSCRSTPCHADHDPDATVHILYEVAGTIGAFASAAAISRFGNNYSFFLTPVFFTCAGIIWLFIIPSKKKVQSSHGAAELAAVESKPLVKSYFIAIYHGAVLFLKSIWVGTRLIFGHRHFIWLFSSYSIALYLHRFLESSLAPAFAR